LLDAGRRSHAVADKSNLSLNFFFLLLLAAISHCEADRKLT
jgi:hypothetical protein